MTLDDSYQTIPVNCGPPLPYWRETQRPFCNLIFLVPLLFVYELGVLLAAHSRGTSIRNGADAWLRLWLNQVGIEIVWMPPALLLGALIAWHMVTRQPWKTTWETLGGMVAESLLYAFLLIMIGQLVDLSFRQAGSPRLQMGEGLVSSGTLIRLVTFMGAGIYEEFLFRLCLLPISYLALRVLLVPKHWAIAVTVVGTSVVFSLAHYLGSDSGQNAISMLADAFFRVQSSRDLWFSFVFRVLAGMFFAGLYFYRGFGITVGAHATYDVVVGVILIQEI
ncbi:CPBP family intramembrane glutamic endopeptidase [Schlesneria paludicola]|uniref:CPBP family intramembrane glutamic endopeptidase n=1 Tax=Schlesneria paludicola TaxID=360056 RepID=UPI0003166681|nr:CPBP family intramembrane glutamic endopeptidase [Schlesneria paludicola]